jgi:hypothetical protein
LDIERNLSSIISNESGEPLNLTIMEEIKGLEEMINDSLKKEEQEWRQQIRSFWLQAEDNNTKFFHKFSNHRRNVNTIWEIKSDLGDMVSSFHKNAEVGACYFENIFKALAGCPI